jgi:organic radical activating enzyme
LFYSLQGEGRYAGTPALFIRFKYCNLGCAWCDTKFTWDLEKIEPGFVKGANEVCEDANALLRNVKMIPRQVHVIFTGGEPMLHQHRLPLLISQLQSFGFDFFEMETNGTIVPSLEMATLISWWNCSPKLRNNGLDPIQNIVPAALREIELTDRADFKFVVQNKSDIDEIEREFLHIISRKGVMLMPEGVTRESILAKTGWLMEECQKRGFRFSSRLHILAWGNERGK